MILGEDVAFKSHFQGVVPYLLVTAALAWVSGRDGLVQLQWFPCWGQSEDIYVFSIISDI